ncbi:MAG: family 43 glycosylhydrolase [Magnetospirillum sp.]|nr:family 43 glycosylhydrolase [Magnetospirillum sp.]
MMPFVSASATDPKGPAGEIPLKATRNALLDAYVRLGPQGGVIAINGVIELPEDFTAPKHDGVVTIVGGNGNGSERVPGGRLVLKGDLSLGGPTRFTNVEIVNATKDATIITRAQPLWIASGVTCVPNGNGLYPSIAGAPHEVGAGGRVEVTIDSGEWENVTGASAKNSTQTSGTIRIVVNGGTFRKFSAVGSAQHSGDVAVTINGGEFFGGVNVLAEAGSPAVDGEVALTITGGTYYNEIAASRNSNASMRGNYTLTITGGNFASLVEMRGAANLNGGATSQLVANAELLDRPNIGQLSFGNPLIEGADPWVFLHEGFYYATSTGGSRLVGRKVANLPDLGHAEKTTIFAPKAGQPYSRNLWSPKIYYLSEERFGKDAGFYLYFTANDGSGRSALDHRLFVARSLTGSPLGPYGSPEDATPHVPVRVASENGVGFNDEWVAGPKVLHHGGKNYLIWVGRFGGPESKKVGDHRQFLAIDELITPWTVAGRPAIICLPTLPWEKHGAGITGKGDQRRMLPEVVEGGTPVVADDGTLYLLYAASGYWTPYYAIGLMKLAGTDPMNPDHWIKSPAPVFKASKEIVGSANACYVSSPTGESHWAIYHAYVGQKTIGVPRQLFAEPYVADHKTMTIGQGTPAPLSTTMKIEVNPMPLRKKIRDFSTLRP